MFDQFSAESGRALFELFFWMFDKRRTTAVDTAKVTCPVLVVSGSDDKVVSAVTGRQDRAAVSRRPPSTKPPAAAIS